MQSITQIYVIRIIKANFNHKNVNIVLIIGYLSYLELNSNCIFIINVIDFFIGKIDFQY